MAYDRKECREYMLREAEYLREELVLHQGTVRNALFFGVSAWGGLMAYGLGQEQPLVLLAAPPFLCVLYRYVAGRRRHITRMGHYIRLMIEPFVPGLEWEQAFDDAVRQPATSGGSYRPALRSDELAIFVALAAATLGGYVFANRNTPLKWPPDPWLLAGGAWLVGCLVWLVALHGSWSARWSDPDWDVQLSERVRRRTRLFGRPWFDERAPSEAPVVVWCPHCHSHLQARPQLAGKRARCGQCRGLVEVPRPAAT